MEITPRQLEIIEAAGEILTRYGVNGLTTKSLATRIGFSESALYRHFSGKEEIILTMLHFMADDMNIRLGQVSGLETDPEKKLTAIFNSQFEFFKKNPHFLIAMLSEGLYEASPAINQAISKIMNTVMQHLIPVVALGQQKSIFTSSLPPESLCHIIMGSFRLLMLKWRVSGMEFDIKQKGNQQIIDLFRLIKLHKNNP